MGDARVATHGDAREATCSRECAGRTQPAAAPPPHFPRSAVAATAATDTLPFVPQVTFNLDRVMDHMEKILAERGHVVVCMAEGAGQVRRRRRRDRPGCACPAARPPGRLEQHACCRCLHPGPGRPFFLCPCCLPPCRNASPSARGRCLPRWEGAARLPEPAIPVCARAAPACRPHLKRVSFRVRSAAAWVLQLLLPSLPLHARPCSRGAAGRICACPAARPGCLPGD